MTTTQVKTSAFNFEEFAEDTETEQRLPYCQVISPPNITNAQIEQLSPPYGLFIKAEEAAKAGFKVDAKGRWQAVQVQFASSGDDPPEDGFITRNPRFVILHRSQIEVQQQDESNRWRFIGLAYVNGQPTAHWDSYRNEKDLPLDRRTMRAITRYLLLFLDDKNNPLHSTPIALTAKGGFGSAFGVEVRECQQQLSSVYFKAAATAGKPISGNRLTDTALAYGVCDFELDFYRIDAQKSPFIVPSARLAAAIDMVGKTKDVDRRDRKVKLTGAPLTEMMLSKSCPTGQIIGQLLREYKDFSTPYQPQHLATIETVGEFSVQAIDYMADGGMRMPFHSFDGKVYQTLVKSEYDWITDTAGQFKISGVFDGTLLTVSNIEAMQASYNTPASSFDMDKPEDYDEIF